jgi:hypothetical protein
MSRAAISNWETEMTAMIKCAATAAFIAMLWAVPVAVAKAEIKNYEFQLVEPAVRKGDGVAIAVRLIDKTKRQAVPDAVIFAKRIDMAPDGMAMMDAPLDPVVSTELGVYRFKTNLSMAGNWQLSLAAKVQGEEGTVESKLILKALP